MSNGEPGRVYWSGTAQRFYQEGRRGSVSTEDALSHLRQDEQGRLRDTLGRFVPNSAVAPKPSSVRRFIGHDSENRPFVSATFRDNLTTRETYNNVRLPGNKMLVVRTVVRTPDGKVHVSYTSSKLGGRINTDRLDALADKRAAGDLWGKKYSTATNTIGNNTLRRDYIVREVEVRGKVL